MSDKNETTPKKTINELILIKMFKLLEDDDNFENSLVNDLKELSRNNELSNQTKVHKIVKSSLGKQK